MGPGRKSTPQMCAASDCLSVSFRCPNKHASPPVRPSVLSPQGLAGTHGHTSTHTPAARQVPSAQSAGQRALHPPGSRVPVTCLPVCTDRRLGDTAPQESFFFEDFSFGPMKTNRPAHKRCVKNGTDRAHTLLLPGTLSVGNSRPAWRQVTAGT